MKYLYRSLETFAAAGEAVILRIRTDGETLFCSLCGRDGDALPAITVGLSYNGAARTMTRSPDGRLMTAEFPYADAVRSLGLSGTAFTYQEQAVDTVRWLGGFHDPDPVLTLDLAGIRIYDTAEVREAAVTVPDGLNLKLLEVRQHQRTGPGAPWSYHAYYYNYSFLSNPFRLYVGSSMTEGAEVRFNLLYAAYAPGTEDDHGSYLGLFEADTDLVTVTPRYAPYAPKGLTVGEAAAGAAVSVRWTIPENDTVPAASVELGRSVNGGAFTLVASGLFDHFSDTLPMGAQTVAYRVRSLSSGGKISSWVSSGTAEVIQSNLRVKTASGLKIAAGLFVGIGGRPVRAVPVVRVGGRNA